MNRQQLHDEFTSAVEKAGREYIAGVTALVRDALGGEGSPAKPGRKAKGIVAPEPTATGERKPRRDLSDLKVKVAAFIKKNKGMTAQEIADGLKIPRDGLGSVLGSLRTSGVIETEGSRRSTVYNPTK